MLFRCTFERISIYTGLKIYLGKSTSPTGDCHNIFSSVVENRKT